MFVLAVGMDEGEGKLSIRGGHSFCSPLHPPGKSPPFSGTKEQRQYLMISPLFQRFISSYRHAIDCLLFCGSYGLCVACLGTCL